MQQGEINPQNASELKQLLHREFDPWELVLALDWSSDGKLLAASVGNRLVLLDAINLKILDSHEVGAFTRGIVFSSQGNILATGSQDGNVRVWRVETAFDNRKSLKEIMEFQAHKKGVNTLGFLPQTDLLYTGGNDAVVRIWRPESGELILEVIGGTFSVPSVAYIPQSNSLALLNGEVVRLRNADEGIITGTFQYDTWFFSITYHPLKDLLVVGDIHNRIFLWDPAEAYRTGRESYPEPQILSGHSGKVGTYESLVWDLDFNLDGSLLASAGGDGIVILWDVDSFQKVAILSAHQRGATCVEFDPLGKRIATGGLDGSISIWGLEPSP